MGQFGIIHYHELGLKGKNRPFFEKKLVENIRKALEGISYDFVKRISGRIIIKLKKETDFPKIEVKLKKIFGIAYFTLAYQSKIEMATLEEDIWQLIRDKKIKRFCIRVKRSEKSFPLTSPEIERRLGGFIKERTGWQVDLETPELTCYVELLSNLTFFSLKKIKGPGGLPSGTSGKIVVLLSAGFDSPVASWQLMKRGAKICFVHFHSWPYTDRASQESVLDLVTILNQYQFSSKLYLVPFSEIQKKVVALSPAKLRVVLYRRMMTRIAQILAQKEKACALASGESLGQVASQTLENIQVISEAVSLPILRPLIGQDKEEIINKAKVIGTDEVSSRPYQDCCSLFIPPHPATKAKLSEVKKAEKNLDIPGLIKKALGATEVICM